MAEMIPDRLPSGASAGEKRVFEVLQRLPDNCIVYYEPVVSERYPDFIVIIPEVGLLIIEVKGWYPAHIESGDSNQIKITSRGRTESQRHPIRQARDYMFRLMDLARKHSCCAPLLHGEGDHEGRFIFPFGYLVVLNNVSRDQLESRGLSELFPVNRVMTRDEFDNLASPASGTLLIAFKSFFDPWWTFPPLDDAQVTLLRTIIHPVPKPTPTSNEIRETLLALDLRQEFHARSVGEGHRIIYGVAGSGKTLILIARARLLAEDSSRRILVLCYNKALAQFLQANFVSQANVICLNFHLWGVRRNGVEFCEDDDLFGQRLLTCLERGKGDANSYDAVLIDEGQDFTKNWFQCAKLALKEPDDGNLVIVCDGNQSVYKRALFSWKEAGIDAQGRTINKRFDLDKNYRNTAEICNAAKTFAASSVDGEPEAGPTAAKPNVSGSIRSGPSPRMLVASSREAECDLAIEQVRNWLSAGLKPNEIGILYRALPPEDRPLMIDFIRKLEDLAPVYWPKGRRGEPKGSVTIRPMFSAKGLQWRAVLILWADLLPYGRDPEQWKLERGLMYVAMTRAEDELVLTRSGYSPFIDEIEAALHSMNDRQDAA
jgi:hypothetical protein